MYDLNDELFEFWPCPLCFYGFGLILGILTLGLTCLCPYFCIKDAKDAFLTKMDKLNAKLEKDNYKVRMRYEEKFFY